MLICFAKFYVKTVFSAKTCTYNVHLTEIYVILIQGTQIIIKEQKNPKTKAKAKCLVIQVIKDAKWLDNGENYRLQKYKSH